jgi:hypothetical protein
MYFNLIMNAVDALSDQKVGILRITDRVEGDRVVVRVSDDGAGMTPEKQQQLLTDKETLDGELHSLGFVFVRQTVDDFQGELSIDSELGKGTTITIRFPFLPAGTAAQRSPSGREEYGLLPHTVSTPRRRDGSPVAPSASFGSPPAGGATGDRGRDPSMSCGKAILDDYEASRAQYPGSIFAIAVTEDDVVDCFTHKPYERFWNITHEDLSPMLFQSTVRGRLEEGDQKTPVLILKPPQSMGDYFDLKEVPQSERSSARYLRMVHDECIRVARKLIATGLPPGTGAHLADAQRYFPNRDELLRNDPFPIELLAKQELISEKES